MRNTLSPAKTPLSTKLSTPSKKQDPALAELKRYRLLVENIQDYAIFLLDENGRIASWNKGAEINKGYEADEIIGKHFSIFYLPQDIKANKPARALELAQRYGRVEDEDWRVKKDGSKFWASVFITALYDRGKLVGFAKVTRNLTERKRYEDELNKANALLREQQRTLELLNTAKDEFISLASHQLRTPATSIKQYLGIILEGFAGVLRSDQELFVKKAYESNERQIETVNDLLKVAQIDAGKVVLQKVPTNIKKLIKSVVEDYTGNMVERQQQLEINVASDNHPVILDPHLFRMVIENVLDNASKYTPPGGKITITTRNTAHMFTLSIRDTGVGIAKRDIDKLFTKFGRIHNPLSDRSGGTGLGLYWVSKVIEQHQGKIDVTSELNKGTTFTIYVPTGELSA
jgi:PAS domain S-box-containing protein